MKQLIDENPMKTAQKILATLNSRKNKVATKPSGIDGKIVTDTEKKVGEQLQEEFGDIDDAGVQQMSKGARLRLEKKRRRKKNTRRGCER